MEEIPPKLYKWQKRNNNSNKHNSTKDLAGAGGGHVMFLQGMAEFEVTPPSQLQKI